MSTEETVDSDWKVLVSATQKACERESILRQRKNCPRKSYAEFVQEIKRTKSKINASIHHYCEEDDVNSESESVAKDDDGNFKSESIAKEDDVQTQEKTDVLGDWKTSDVEDFSNVEGSRGEKDENENKVIKNKMGKRKRGHHRSRKMLYERTEDDIFFHGSSDSEGTANIDYGEEKDIYSQEDSSWESISTSSAEEDVTFDQFWKSVKDASRNSSASARCTAYKNLTECLLSHYYPESEDNVNSNQQTSQDSNFNYAENQQQSNDYSKDFNQNDQLSLEERLPMMQVLDTLNDVNKVLKAGKITPRMERVLEYKQHYPFTEGYQEETLGWCPWLVYKLEMLWKRISAKQWPN